MKDETALGTAVREARHKLNELRKIWLEKYPDNVDQTYYRIALTQMDLLMDLILLSGGVSE